MILVVLTVWVAISLVFLLSLAVVARQPDHETGLTLRDAEALDQVPVLATLNRKSVPIAV
jgi:hypothetical protein